MKKKILFVILMLILVSGCKAKYTVKINKDGSVEETLVATETPEYYDNYSHTSVGKVISYVIDPYIDLLNNKKYTVNTSVNVNSDSGATVKKKYSDFKDYIGNSIVYSQFTDKIEYEEKGDKVSISLKGKFSSSDQNQAYVPVKEGSITIVVPYKVIDNNADKVEGNSYTWLFENNKGEEREIRISYTKSKIANLDFNYSVIIIIAILIVLGILALVMVRKFKKSNKDANKI